jgi:hypothetical protein
MRMGSGAIPALRTVKITQSQNTRPICKTAAAAVRLRPPAMNALRKEEKQQHCQFQNGALRSTCWMTGETMSSSFLWRATCCMASATVRAKPRASDKASMWTVLVGLRATKVECLSSRPSKKSAQHFCRYIKCARLCCVGGVENTARKFQRQMRSTEIQMCSNRLCIDAVQKPVRLLQNNILDRGEY